MTLILSWRSLSGQDSLTMHEHGDLPNVNIEATWQLQSCRSMNVSQDAAKEPVEESTLKVWYSNSLGL